MMPQAVLTISMNHKALTLFCMRSPAGHSQITLDAFCIHQTPAYIKHQVGILKCRH